MGTPSAVAGGEEAAGAVLGAREDDDGDWLGLGWSDTDTDADADADADAGLVGSVLAGPSVEEV